MKNLTVKPTVFAFPKLIIMLLISLMINSSLSAKIETKKLLYLREALSGKMSDKARIITLAGVTAFAAAQLGLTKQMLTCWNRSLKGEHFIKDPAWREYWYQKFKMDKYIELEKKERLHLGWQPPHEGWDAFKEKRFSQFATTAFFIPAFFNLIFGSTLFASFYQVSKQFRPTNNVAGLKYPFLCGLNSPGVTLYWICQKLFFDYRHNLINLLKNYDREKIPTIFLPTFDKLAAEYKAKQQISMDKELQHFFVLDILKKIQEELLEEITIFSFPQFNNSIEKALAKIKTPEKQKEQPQQTEKKHSAQSTTTNNP